MEVCTASRSSIGSSPDSRVDQPQYSKTKHTDTAKTTNGHNQLAREEYVKVVLKNLKFTKTCYATFKE